MGQLLFTGTQRASDGNIAIRVVPPKTDVFIETGTCLGETLINATEVYNECHSIECYRPAYFDMIKRFLHEPRAKIYFGSSPDVLPWIIDPKKSTLFWLDAHFVPGNDLIVDRYGQCPLLAELDVIMSVEWQSMPYIIIDDAHCFNEMFWTSPTTTAPQHNGKVVEDVVCVGYWAYLRKGMKREEWPTFEQIKTKLPKHHLTVNIETDAIMCVPHVRDFVPTEIWNSPTAQ